MRGLMWFRNDLRVGDNTALLAAAKNCSSGIVGLYIIDQSMWKQHQIANCHIQFIMEGIKQLSIDLSALHIPLVVKQVKHTKYIPDLMVKLMKNTKTSILFYNREYEVDECKRDDDVQSALNKYQLEYHASDDQLILPPGKVLSLNGQPFKVFTAYKRAWLKEYQKTKLFSFKKPKIKKKIMLKKSTIPKLKHLSTVVDMTVWPAGEKNARKRLHAFLQHKLSDYLKQRDYPAIAGTSKLSPYLATGMISARECFSKALKANHGELYSGQKGALTWMSELIWRDFYKQILISNPRVSRNQPFQLATKKIQWNYNANKLKAWQKGQTGFPLVDAAMRQLNQTGWMHNRLRMVVATFLTKHLLFDWHLGEAYFMERLIDGDLSANNGGWQWCASTGTDAVPYFRVFNPVTQSERFDPQGEFIKLFCPELKNFTPAEIHEPYRKNPKLASQVKYPKPIVSDLKASRKRAIAAFKSIRHHT